MNPRLFPFAERDLSDLAIEKGQEKPKQHNIKNSNIPTSVLLFRHRQTTVKIIGGR
jgi:hypothetical protein